MKKLLVITTLVAAISACGSSGGNDSPDSQADNSPRSSSAPSSSAALSSVSSSNTSSSSSFNVETASGQEIFGAMCSQCHQLSAPSLNAWQSEQDLAMAIETSMPLLSPTDCGSVCATKVASYIATNAPNFGQVSSSSSSTPNLNDDIVAPQGSIDPAPVALRRLNREEYNNTVRDLLGTQLQPANEFPEDDFGYGFNNIAKVLTVSLTHLEKYKTAAERLAHEAVTNATPLSLTRFEAEDLEGNLVNSWSGMTVLGQSASNLQLNYYSPRPGPYRVTIQAGQMAGGDEDAHMQVLLNESNAYQTDVPNSNEEMQSYTFTANFSAKDNYLSFHFTNDFWIEDEADRNLAIDWIEIEGPLDAQTSDDRAIPCDLTQGESCARQTIEQLGAKAWRRPVSDAELERLLGAYQTALAASNAYAAMESLIQAILLSPNFMFRAEFDESTGSQARALNGYELASRLSYFLWSSMPDERLFLLAENGNLLLDTVLRAEVQRMLDDPKSLTLIENFAVQWLSFDKVNEVSPDTALFPNFDEALKESMRTETRLFIDYLLETNAPISELFLADYSFINSELAAHYGLNPSLFGSGFQRVDWSASAQRSGLLGHASVLTSTSHPASTSPVKRGVWVLDKLLCKKPPPPPPGVENITEDASFEGLSTRERFELHQQTSSVCFGCHALMDPIGFGLENFDPIGQWRDYEGENVVDASGELPDGTLFNGPVDLANILGQSSDLPLCTIQHMMTYALGRGVEALDANAEEELPDYPAVYDVYTATQAQGHRLKDIIEEIVLSPAFRNRRAPTEQ